MKDNRIQGLVIIFVGLVLISTYSLKLVEKRSLSFNLKYTNSQEEELSDANLPVRIDIPSLKISLPIEESSIVNGIWEISDKGANHLNVSSIPGKEGNIVIYAHNNRSLFGPIFYIKKDAEIKITTGDENSWNYKVFNIIEGSPDDIGYVLPKDEETLTIYTCSGFADSKRFIVIAKPIQ